MIAKRTKSIVVLWEGDENLYILWDKKTGGRNNLYFGYYTNSIIIAKAFVTCQTEGNSHQISQLNRQKLKTLSIMDSNSKGNIFNVQSRLLHSNMNRFSRLFNNMVKPFDILIFISSNAWIKKRLDIKVTRFVEFIPKPICGTYIIELKMIKLLLWNFVVVCLMLIGLTYSFQ